MRISRLRMRICGRCNSIWIRMRILTIWIRQNWLVHFYRSIRLRCGSVCSGMLIAGVKDGKRSVMWQCM